MVRNYLIVTASYWGFTLVDGALRMLVLFHFFRMGYTPFTLAFLFLLYEAAGIGANLAGGYFASRFGIPRMLAVGQIRRPIDGVRGQPRIVLDHDCVRAGGRGARLRVTDLGQLGNRRSCGRLCSRPAHRAQQAAGRQQQCLQHAGAPDR